MLSQLIPVVLSGFSHAMHPPQARGKGLWQRVTRQVKLRDTVLQGESKVSGAPQRPLAILSLRHVPQGQLTRVLQEPRTPSV